MDGTPRHCLADIRAATGQSLPVAVVISVLASLAEGSGLLLLGPMLLASDLGGGGSAASAQPWMARLASLGSFDALLLIWLAAVLIMRLLVALRDGLLIRLQEGAASHFRLALHDALTAMGMVAFHQEQTAHITAALTHSATRLGIGISALVQILARASLIAVQIALALVVAPVGVVIALAACLLIVSLQWPRLRRVTRQGRQEPLGVKALYTTIGEHLGGLKLAKAHHAEPAMRHQFSRQIGDWAQQIIQTRMAMIRWQTIGKLLVFLVLLLVAWAAIRLYHMPLASLLVLMAVLTRLLQVMDGLNQQIHNALDLWPTWQDYHHLRHRLEKAAEPPAAHGTIPPLAGDIVLQGVTFTWPDRHDHAIGAVDLTLTEYSTTAIIGPSGAGKSTLAELIIGLLPPCQGTITIGGTRLTADLYPHWRSMVAYVPQDSHLLHASIRDNVTWFCPQADDDQVWQALALAALDGMVRALPQGLATVIGDRGIRLSGGERQRLALARALIRRPRLLVLDEATSHLDRPNEAMVQQAITTLHGHVTMLVIAHRLDTIRQADTIVVLDQGRIREQGRWDDLQGTPQSWINSA